MLNSGISNIKVFACNSAEEFTKEICDNLGIEMGQKDSFKFANDNCSYYLNNK